LIENVLEQFNLAKRAKRARGVRTNQNVVGEVVEDDDEMTTLIRTLLQRTPGTNIFVDGVQNQSDSHSESKSERL
jgi:hypothetical protein